MSATSSLPPAAALAQLPLQERSRVLDALSPNAQAALPHLWEVWARPATQRPPPGEWSTWLILGGRGSGKTRTGAEWVRNEVEGATPLAAGKRARLALIAETVDQAREVMVEGESGLLRLSPADRRPILHATRRMLCWPNGARAWLFSASDPESLRGPQFDGAWCDEMGKWRKPQEAWDMLQFGLRVGRDPRQVVTTTPRPNPALLALARDPATRITRSPTHENAANLAPGFIERMDTRYGGRGLGRQELEGEFVLDTPGAFWTRELIERNRIAQSPPLARIVVAVDPPVTGHAGSDACGIVVAGLVTQQPDAPPHAVVLADWSVQGRSPRGWAERAVAAWRAHEADRLIAEVNQGGDMVEEILRQVEPDIAFKAIRATRGKSLRAEPVAALYEQGRVRHLATPGHTALATLEAQMCAFGPQGLMEGGRSPDRVDALVWAITELLLGRIWHPRLRSL